MTSKIKVDNVNKVSDDSNIINKCGTTITLGASGDTVNLASGASQSGFGREGSVNWQTGSIKTGTFTATSGEGYFVDTSGSTATANLPAGSAGAIVAFSDYARNFANNKLTISPNGSEKIGGIDADLDLEVNGQALTLVYVDGTQGWINVQNAEDTETGVSPYIIASVSGSCNTLVTSGDYKIATFKNPGTFCVSAGGTPSGSNTVDYLVIAGAGAGKSGGGGAGGVRFYASPDITTYPASPRNGPAALPVTAQGYPITVGGGGSAPSTAGCAAAKGSDSIFSSITSTGGGQGGFNPGGSGGGGYDGCSSGNQGQGNTPSTSPSQGSNGGCGSIPGQWGSGGGGGFMAVGANATPGTWTSLGGDGGAGGGFPTALVGTNGVPSSCEQYFGGGGGGQTYGNPGPNADGGLGGGGRGGIQDGGGPSPGPTFPACAGTANTGGGGGGTYSQGANGGSGIVIIRYKFQN